MGSESEFEVAAAASTSRFHLFKISVTVPSPILFSRAFSLRPTPRKYRSITFLRVAGSVARIIIIYSTNALLAVMEDGRMPVGYAQVRTLTSDTLFLWTNKTVGLDPLDGH